MHAFLHLAQHAEGNGNACHLLCGGGATPKEGPLHASPFFPLPPAISITEGLHCMRSSRTGEKMGDGRGRSFMVIGAAMALLAAALLSARGAGALEICNMDDEQLAECLPAIRGPSPPSPSDSCCAALRTADLPCLCRYKGSVVLRSVGLDPKLAAALPAKCNIESPAECSSVP